MISSVKDFLGVDLVLTIFLKFLRFEESFCDLKSFPLSITKWNGMEKVKTFLPSARICDFFKYNREEPFYIFRFRFRFFFVFVFFYKAKTWDSVPEMSTFFCTTETLESWTRIEVLLSCVAAYVELSL